ncbi:P-loop containing nucleoside triphosphate hydrolase protein [Syncephalis fuscata]|nr:P-loop containing nucleoside triphosphate hydrolase protein [Syncephalis fuscata]
MDDRLADLATRGSIPLLPAQLARLANLMPPVITCADLLVLTEFELVEQCDWDLLTVRTILLAVSRLMAPKSLTALELFEEAAEQQGFLSTGHRALDSVLCGGLPCGSITEVVAQAGSGKTQLCHTLAVLAAYDRNDSALHGDVVYFDTERTFRADRLVEIAQHRFPELVNDQARLRRLTNRVHVAVIRSADELLTRLNSLMDFIKQKKVCCVIIDSTAALVRHELVRAPGIETPSAVTSPQKHAVERNDFLIAEAKILKKIAETQQIPVLVTNQVTTRFQQPSVLGLERSDASNDGYNIAALGNTWSHAITTRIELRRPATIIKKDQSVVPRQLSVLKSPLAAVCTFKYSITAAGFVEMSEA